MPRLGHFRRTPASWGRRTGDPGNWWTKKATRCMRHQHVRQRFYVVSARHRHATAASLRPQPKCISPFPSRLCAIRKVVGSGIPPGSATRPMPVSHSSNVMYRFPHPPSHANRTQIQEKKAADGTLKKEAGGGGDTLLAHQIRVRYVPTDETDARLSFAAHQSSAGTDVLGQPPSSHTTKITAGSGWVGLGDRKTGMGPSIPPLHPLTLSDLFDAPSGSLAKQIGGPVWWVASTANFHPLITAAATLVTMRQSYQIR